MFIGFITSCSCSTAEAVLTGPSPEQSARRLHTEWGTSRVSPTTLAKDYGRDPSMRGFRTEPHRSASPAASPLVCWQSSETALYVPGHALELSLDGAGEPGISTRTGVPTEPCYPSGPSRHNIRTRTWVTARNHRRITAPHTRTFSHGAPLVSSWSSLARRSVAISVPAELSADGTWATAEFSQGPSSAHGLRPDR